MRSLSADRLDDTTLERLFAPLLGRARIGLAVSGGPDSLGLMLLIARWRALEPGAPGATVYTLDHGLRAEAGLEAGMVAAAASRLGLPARVLRWDGPKPRSGLQSAARAARYRLIGAAMASDGAEVLVTAHHLEDQAETILMRLAHRSGLDGLAGMAPWEVVHGVRLFRPLLSVEPMALVAETVAAGLAPAMDPSNADMAYERVRWRRVTPALAALGLDGEAFSTFARRAREASEALDQWCAEAEARLVARHLLGAYRIERRGFDALPRAVGVRLLSRTLRRACGTTGPGALGVVERLADRLATGRSGGYTLMGCLVRARAAEIWVCREAPRISPEKLALGPEARLVWDGRFSIHNRSREPMSVTPALGMSRARAEAALGLKLDLPADAIRAAPLVTSREGGIAGLGEQALDGRVEIRQIGAEAGLNRH